MAGFQIVAKDKDGHVKGLHETFEANKIENKVTNAPSQAKPVAPAVKDKKTKK